MYRTRTTGPSISGWSAGPAPSKGWNEDGDEEESGPSWLKSYVGGHKHRQDLTDELHLGHGRAVERVGDAHFDR
jgi:hypothetical protein